MDDLSYKDPPIEVVASSPRKDMIYSRLKANGLRPGPASESIADSPLPLLIDTRSAPVDVLQNLQRASAMGLARQVILLSKDNISIPGVITLNKDSGLATLASRLASQKRKSLRELEVRLRKETASSLGVTSVPIDAGAIPDLLYLGDGSAFFLELQAALKTSGVSVTAALSLHTALDYLENKRFAAILVDLTKDSEYAVRLLEAVDADPRISSQPVFVCLRDGGHLPDDAREALANANEIIDASSNVQRTADRITFLAHTRAVAPELSQNTSLASTITDPSTKLFTRKFLEAHLLRQMEAAHEAETALSVLTLRLKSGSDNDKSAQTALPDLATLLLPLLRETDSAARIDYTTIAVSLPHTPYAGAVRLAERLVTTLGGDNLGAMGTPLPFGGSLSWKVVERRRYHTASNLIAAAMTGPFARVQAA